MSRVQKPNSELNAQRRRAVQLRLAGKTLAAVRESVGLSSPTIIAAVKAFKSGGWEAVDVKPRGRPSRNSTEAPASEKVQAALLDKLTEHRSATPPPLWSTTEVRDWLKKDQQVDVSLQTAAAYLSSWNWLPENQQRVCADSPATAVQTWLSGDYADFKVSAKLAQATLLWVGARTVKSEFTQLYAHTLRGRCLWMCFAKAPSRAQYQQFFAALLEQFSPGIALVAPNKNILEEIKHYARDNNTSVIGTVAPSVSNTSVLHPTQTNTKPITTRSNTVTNIARANAGNASTDSKKPAKTRPVSTRSRRVGVSAPITNQTPNLSNSKIKAVKGQTMSQPLSSASVAAANNPTEAGASALPTSEAGLTHLQRLEAESIQILREVVAEAENPVMMYSIGKDSAVMLHLARKAFFPAKPPFPLLHVDTTWKFQEMYRFRDEIVKEYGFELLTHTNPEGLEKGVNPFTHGSALHTDIMKTEALKQALDKHGFDVALGGARRDEEKSRAKERVFSFRSAQHRWEPKNQRPELWNLYNTRKQPGESLRTFPLSNWTELDIWQYIHQQNIPIVPLYFAAERPVVERDGTLIMVDDERMPLNEGEVPMMRSVRFRTLGCYPLTGAVESNATTLLDIIQETLLATSSERQGRMIDSDSAASMEKKKQQGYF